MIAFTDNVALCHYIIAFNLSLRMVSWLADIEQYNLQIRRIPVATNTAADALSRLACCPLVLSTDTDSWLDDYRADPAFASHVGLSGALLVHDRLHRGRFWEGDLICVPRRQMLEILHFFHDGATQGHFGTAKTLDLISRRFTFPHMRKAVDTFVQSCPACQVSKAEHANPRGLLKSAVFQLHRWQSIALDWTFLPAFRGFDCVLTITNHATRMVHLIAANSTGTAQVTAKRFFHEVVRLFPFALLWICAGVIPVGFTLRPMARPSVQTKR